MKFRVIEWHGDAAEKNYNQFAKYGGAYGKDSFDLRPILPMITCPTLIIYPDRSSIFDVEQSLAFYRHLRRGDLAVFPKFGQNTYEQRPEDYTRTILNFLTRCNDTKNAQIRPVFSCLA